MTMIDTAKLLAKIGAILCIVLGFVDIAWRGVSLALDLLFFIGWYGTFAIVWDAVYIGLGVVSVILGFIILRKYLPAIDEDPRNTAIYFIVLGIIASFGSLWIGGILVLVAGILILVEKEAV